METFTLAALVPNFCSPLCAALPQQTPSTFLIACLLSHPRAHQLTFIRLSRSRSPSSLLFSSFYEPLHKHTDAHTHTLGPKKGTRLHCSLQLRRCVHFRHTIFPGVRRGDFRATNPRALFRARTGSRTLPKCRKCEPRPRRRTVFRGIVPTGRNGPLFRDTHNL